MALATRNDNENRNQRNNEKYENAEMATHFW